MAITVQGMPGTERVAPARWETPEGVKLFGVRHLSPAGAWHVRRFLEERKPDLVLIESPADTTPLIEEMLRSGVQPPIAVMCYTSQTPVHSLLYPLAAYSPEYQALKWCREHRRESRFIDLPSGIKAPLYRLQEEERTALMRRREELAGMEGAQPAPEIQARLDYLEHQNELYGQIAALGGEDSYDAYWERHFEHNLETDSYLQAVALHSAQMRDLSAAWEREADPLSASINALREGYMKKCIMEAIAAGTPADKIAVICGAYHVQGLMACDPMTEEELAALPQVETKMTLMPYSYYKLSSFSGYGAGNHAPYYYELMYNAMEETGLDRLPTTYLAQVSRELRKRHGYSSTATVIEAVRLARALQSVHGGTQPTLADLHDAAVATMGHGQAAVMAESFAAVDVGTRIGALPEGVSQTPIQDDMNRNLKQLRLEKYKSVVAQNLDLDLRENRRVQRAESAFLDLDRSVFLHRLHLLGIGFARPVEARQEAASWAEHWVLCWTPEVEIQVVESVLLGDTIEAAAAYTLREQLEQAASVDEVAALVRQTCLCRLESVVFDAVRKLQEMTAEAESFSAVARAARQMSALVQYGSIRKFQTEPVIPILQQLFVKGALLLVPSAACNDDAARSMAGDMGQMHDISQEHDQMVNDELWLTQLTTLSRAMDRNPLLCGFAFSILLERGRTDAQELNTQVSLHLSAGNSPEGGAAWFEGLSRRNRYVLLSRPMLWEQLDGYLGELDDDGFKRALVCLRRAFGAFEPHEKSGVCDILAELWGVGAGSVAELLQDELTETEEQALDDLNDFDFEDL